MSAVDQIVKAKVWRCLEGESLSPEEVTLQPGLQPSLVRHRGDRRGASEFTKSLWAFSGREPGQEWPALEEGLRTLLQEVAPLRSSMEPYFQSCSVYWWCGSFQSQFGSTATLSPDLFKLLAAFGAPVHLSSYLSEESAD